MYLNSGCGDDAVSRVRGGLAPEGEVILCLCMRPLPYLCVYVLPAVLLLTVGLNGWWAWATVGVAFGFLPVVDAVVRPTKMQLGDDQLHWGWDMVVNAYAPVQTVVLVYVISYISAEDMPLAAKAGYTVSLGVVTGSCGITVAHELMHRPRVWQQGVAEYLMALVAYPHFCIEHVMGHHRRVATPEDPATARRGQSLWAFVPNAIWGEMRSAWFLEKERVRSLSLPWWADRRLRQPLLVLAIVAIVLWIWGPAGGMIWGVQAAVAVFLLQTIDYIEHYGLVRKRLANGRYERVQPRHSWNSSHRISNWHLINLARHSDHHYLASRPYPCLRHMDDAPQLPAGYPTMALLAIVPPLWRWIMDPRVDAWNKAQG
ncbi:MAG: alkane 1-monooxygenase [Myxococcales bacterium]|nr:alkane 1-monooxygenase [Myxococcales bacterium]